jgi:enterochelin esterase family protein
MSELRMPAYRPPPEIVPDPSIPRGRVETHDFTSRVLGNTRKVHVYLPAGYLRATARYPVAYFGDGTNYLEEAKLAAVLDNAIVQTTVRPLIAVLVDPVNRREEYRANPDYRRFVVEELVPFIDGAYRTIDAPEARVVSGSSRGALAAVDLAFHHPDLFGFVVALSPALRPSDIVGEIERGQPKPVRFYVVGSRYDAEWLPDARRLRDVLLARGYDVVYQEIPEGHDTLAWRARIDDALAAFLPGG